MTGFRFDGRELTAQDGASVAAALLANGVTSWRVTRDGLKRRGLFCGIGQCFDCLVEVDGRGTVRACQEPLRPGDEVRTHSLDSRPAAAAGQPGMLTADVAVVGAGPGGMAAALAAARAGCRVVLIDAGPRLGGQIYRQPATGAVTLPERFAAIASRPEIAVLSGATVWHARQDGADFVLHASGLDGRGTVARARAVVLAPGAGELVLPFPGWTLPGVITAGAAQALIKAHDAVPGRRVLVTGTGPLLLRAAADLVRHGATVVAVCEAARPGRLLASLPRALRHPGKLAEGVRYAATLARARVPVLSGWSVSSFSGSSSGADGPGGSVTVGNGGRSRTFAVDVVAVSHGLIPSLELPRALGCRDEPLAGHPASVVIVDGQQQTSTPGVFACGELTGVGGAAKAEHEGTVAGHAAARYLGLDGDVTARTRRAARSGRRFASLLARLYPVPATGVLPPDTIVCRCEEVTLAAVEGAVAAGAADLRAVKGLTRCGMGYCQGRVCGPIAQLLIARLGPRPLAEVGDLHTRHIGVPVSLAELRTADNARSGGPA